MATKLLNPVYIRSLISKNPFWTKICSNSSRNYSVAKALEVVDLDCLPNPSTPWLMLPPEGQFDKFYSPADNQLVRINREKSLGVPSTAKCVASTRGWLGYVDGQGICPVYLSDPFKGQEINVVSLPPLSTLCCFIDPTFVSEREAAYMARRQQDYQSEWGGDLKDMDESPLCHDKWGRCIPSDMAASPFLSQLTLSHPDPRSPDCKVVAQQRHYEDKYPDLCYFPIGLNMNNHIQDFTWLEPDYDIGMKWLDWQFVFSSPSNLFYATHYESCSNLEALNIHNENIEITAYAFDDFDWLGDAYYFLRDLDGPELIKSLRRDCERDHYLVALENGDLLVVFRYHKKHYDQDNRPEITMHFDVFKHDFKNKGLKLLDSLDGQSLFIGPNQSFCGEFPGMLPDSIYFSVQQLYYRRRNYDCPVGIFNMKDNTVRPCYPFADATFSYPENAFWVAPRLYNMTV